MTKFKLFIAIVCMSVAFAVAKNNFKYNRQTETWAGKWMMKSDTVTYFTLYDDDEHHMAVVDKHKCAATIVVYGEDNINSNSVNFKVNTDCFADSIYISAYDGTTWVGDFWSGMECPEGYCGSYTDQITSYFGPNMLQYITNLHLYVSRYDEVYGKSAGTHCYEGYEKVKGEYGCFDSDSLKRDKCINSGKFFVDGECQIKKVCGANDYYDDTRNICEAKAECSDDQFYDEADNVCLSKPDNSHWYYRDQWKCNAGYVQTGSICVAKAKCSSEQFYDEADNVCLSKPDNSYWYYRNQWKCDDGYIQTGSICEAKAECSDDQFYDEADNKCLSKPDNSHWYYRNQWKCNAGYVRRGSICEAKTECSSEQFYDEADNKCLSKPDNSHWTVNTDWACDDGYVRNGLECAYDGRSTKKESHIYADGDIGYVIPSSSPHTTPDSGIGISITIGYNLAAEIHEYITIGLNANATFAYFEWEYVTDGYRSSYYEEDPRDGAYSFLGLGIGGYIKLFKHISYTGDLMLPAFDKKISDEEIKAEALGMHKFSIELEHVMFFVKLMHSGEIIGYTGFGIGYKW